MTPVENLTVALMAFTVYRTPAKITAALRSGGRDAILDAAGALAVEELDHITAKAGSMREQGLDAVLWGEDNFPVPLVVDGRPLMPVIFFKGNRDLFYADGIGMCGSRNVSEAGLLAAERCGVSVSEADMSIVSGYAKGVDTATHLAALRTGGRTVIVLAEGFDHFRIKRDFASDFDLDRTLVLSQFAPGQTWQAHAAMARNQIIYGLSKALVVIEAGERGGTLAAGEGAMKIGRPVLVVDFGERNPEGNRILLAKGAIPVTSPKSLHKALDDLEDTQIVNTKLF